MSTFLGILPEIPHISIDRFDADNLNSKIFLLSHSHSDHMRGLGTFDKVPGPLYTSALSCAFLKYRFPKLKDIRILEIESPTEITYTSEGKDYNIVVTALPAFHCPGSVMFLIETKNSTVLYTGDFRIQKSDFDRLILLQNKRIDVIYLDSTFMLAKYKHFPSQIESINAICQLAEDWTKLGEDCKVIVEIPAQCGSEYLFMELSRKLGCKVYLQQDHFRKCVYIPAMDQCISQDIKKCKIYVTSKYSNWCFPMNAPEKFRIIKPTALFWDCWSPGNPISLETSKEVLRVAYSNHCSLTELEDFLLFVKPTSVKLNVLSADWNENQEKYLISRNIVQNAIKASESSVPGAESSNQTTVKLGFSAKSWNTKTGTNENSPLPKRLKFTSKRS